MEFDLATAQRFAAAGRTAEWVDQYTRSGHWANLGLADGLQLQQRYWLGPMQIPLQQLVRVCGPELEMLYRVSLKSWECRVGGIVDSLSDPSNLPPIIVEYQNGTLHVRDGNHRWEALRRLGQEQAWILIWFNSVAEQEEFELARQDLFR